MTKTIITLSVTYGSWSKSCKIHVVDDATGKRLGDGREPKSDWGRAGTFDDVDCKKCRRKLDALIKDPDITVVDGWTGEEAK